MICDNCHLVAERLVYMKVLEDDNWDIKWICLSCLFWKLKQAAPYSVYGQNPQHLKDKVTNKETGNYTDK